MNATILHENPGRMRLSLPFSSLTLAQAGRIEKHFSQEDFILKAIAHDRTGDLTLLYTPEKRDDVKNAVARVTSVEINWIK